MERAAFLDRVRERLTGVHPPPLPRDLPRTAASGDGRPPAARFVEELGKVGGVAEVVSRADLAEAVAAAARATEAAVAVVSPDVGPYGEEVAAGLREAGVEEVAAASPEEWREAAARADLGVTGALAAVASSGSLLVSAGAASSRLASLLPKAHLAVLSDDRLLPGFEELFAALPDTLAHASSAVLVTGPSRTADIEMELVRGVHGPRQVHVLLVEEPGTSP